MRTRKQSHVTRNILLLICLIGFIIFFFLNKEILWKIERDSFFSFENPYESLFIKSSLFNRLPESHYHIASFASQFYVGKLGFLFPSLSGFLFAFLCNNIATYWIRSRKWISSICIISGTSVLWAYLIFSNQKCQQVAYLSLLSVLGIFFFIRNRNKWGKATFVILSLFMLSGIVATITHPLGLLQSNRNSEIQMQHQFLSLSQRRFLCKTERLILEKRWNEVLAHANTYWFSHPCSIEDVVLGKTISDKLDRGTFFFRQNLANMTRTALLGSGRLIDDFFLYYRVPEIYNSLNLSDGYYPLQHINELLLGNSSAAYSQLLSDMRMNQISFNKLIKALSPMIACDEILLARKFNHLLKYTLFHRKDYKIFAHCIDIKENGIICHCPHCSDIATYTRYNISRLTSNSIDEAKKALDYWSQNSNPHSLEYLILHSLLRKDIPKTLGYVKCYLAVPNNSTMQIPKSIQTLILILEREGSYKELIIDLLPDGFKFDPNITNQLGLFFEAKRKFETGEISPIELTRNFGHTFAYNYYFSRFIESRPNTNTENNVFSH